MLMIVVFYGGKIYPIVSNYLGLRTIKGDIRAEGWSLVPSPQKKISSLAVLFYFSEMKIFSVSALFYFFEKVNIFCGSTFLFFLKENMFCGGTFIFF